MVNGDPSNYSAYFHVLCDLKYWLWQSIVPMLCFDERKHEIEFLLNSINVLHLEIIYTYIIAYLQGIVLYIKI